MPFTGVNSKIKTLNFSQNCSSVNNLGLSDINTQNQSKILKINPCKSIKD